MSWLEKIMRKYIFLLFIIFLCSCLRQDDFKFISINDQIIKVEVANTPESRYEGLSGRENLCADCGMLFVFPDKSVRTFVMRNMNFPLDIIWIDGDEIKKISKNLPLEGAQPAVKYSSDAPIDYVLEVNGGFCENYEIKVGDKIIL